MCGRAIRTSPLAVLEALLELTQMPDVLPTRYNLAPRDPIPVVRVPHRLEMMRWGLTMPDPRMTGINAKLESLGRVYGDAIQARRCLVVTDGFFEWKTLGDKKFPYLIHRDDQQPVVFGGIFDADGVAILTKPSAGVVKELHARMPVILEREAFAAWLDPSRRDVKGLLQAANADGLSMFPVSTDVNSVRNDRPELIQKQPEPALERPRQQSLF